MKVLGIIPARGGSKRLPGKNLRPFRGIPLIAHTIRAARAARGVTDVLVSTDDAAIAEVAVAEGCPPPFLRPVELATDSAESVDVALHALDALEAHGGRYDAVALLQPTSPFRVAEDIDSCVAECIESRAPAAVLVSELPKPISHYRILATDNSLAAVSLSSVLDGRSITAITGGCYVTRTSVLRATRSFFPDGAVAVKTPWIRAVDIDSLEDFVIAEALAPIACGDALGQH
jgi:CMP-N,N'-diacetyllegionaminic acid synthase